MKNLYTLSFSPVGTGCQHRVLLWLSLDLFGALFLSLAQQQKKRNTPSVRLECFDIYCYGRKASNTT